MKAFFSKKGEVWCESVSSASIDASGDYCLIKVASASLSHLDFLQFADLGKTHNYASVSGVVTAVGEAFGQKQEEEDQEITVGTEVLAVSLSKDFLWFLPGKKQRHLGLQQYLAVKFGRVVAKPRHLSHVQGCTIPLMTCLCQHILTKQLGLAVSQKVESKKLLIHQADGSLGYFLAQVALCLSLDVTVSLSASADNHPWSSLSLKTFASGKERFDIVLDCSPQGLPLSAVREMATPNGKYVAIFRQSSPFQVFSRFLPLPGVSVAKASLDVPLDLSRMGALLVNRRVKPYSRRSDVKDIYSFDEFGVKQALNRVSDSEKDNGVVVVVDENLCRTTQLQKNSCIFPAAEMPRVRKRRTLSVSSTRSLLATVKTGISKLSKSFRLPSRKKAENEAAETAVGVHCQ